MGVFYAKQPNGKYCRFSSIVDCPTDWNMDENDLRDLIISMYLEEANGRVDGIIHNGGDQDFEKVVEYFIPMNMTEEEFQKFLKDVGYEED